MVNHIKQQIFILYLLWSRHCYTLINQLITPLFQIWPLVFTDFSITFGSLIIISKAQHHLTPASISASSHALLCFTQYNESHRPCPHWGRWLAFLLPPGIFLPPPFPYFGVFYCPSYLSINVASLDSSL